MDELCGKKCWFFFPKIKTLNFFHFSIFCKNEDFLLILFFDLRKNGFVFSNLEEKIFNGSVTDVYFPVDTFSFVPLRFLFFSCSCATSHCVPPRESRRHQRMRRAKVPGAAGNHGRRSAGRKIPHGRRHYRPARHHQFFLDQGAVTEPPDLRHSPHRRETKIPHRHPRLRPHAMLLRAGRCAELLQGVGECARAQGGGHPRGRAQGGGHPRGCTQGGGHPRGRAQGGGHPRGCTQGGGRPRGCTQGGGHPRGCVGEAKSRWNEFFPSTYAVETAERRHADQDEDAGLVLRPTAGQTVRGGVSRRCHGGFDRGLIFGRIFFFIPYWAKFVCINDVQSSASTLYRHCVVSFCSEEFMGENSISRALYDFASPPWLIDRLIDWLIDQLCSVVWSIDWLIDWLLFDWLIRGFSVQHVPLTLKTFSISLRVFHSSNQAHLTQNSVPSRLMVEKIELGWHCVVSWAWCSVLYVGWYGYKLSSLKS